ncbi:glycerophosphocholine phosphodiesterase GPCPD1 isoform X1 [Frankliniella occidentalis]|uniref:Glycerophosphocholine phosphodiesterase GPCPD1 isoform X1 n=1 Tax=Frankliniella occidentalis TaxID=133901 RepID=A0A9C6X443_FRAOC|nr:glycerophosphocholine phosphodiesterase GPCPD1 isoform X1 [Frankliniella occidentalis]
MLDGWSGGSEEIMQCEMANDNFLSSHNSSNNMETSRPLRQWTFHVTANNIARGETMCLTGSCSELGSWKSCDVVPMTRLSPEEDSDWTVTLMIPSDEPVEYRYAVCVILEPDGVRYQSRHVIVRRWETNVIPRIIKEQGPQQHVVDEFGHYDHYQRVDRGWLTTQTAIQLKLFNNPIQMWKSKLQGVKLFIKVTPVNLTRSSSSVESVYVGENNLDESLGIDTQDGPQQTDNWPITEVAVMKPGESEFKPQNQFGCPYNKDDVMNFMISLHNPDMVAYLMDFYAYSNRMSDGDPPYHVGFSYILPITLKQSLGQTIVPITNTHQRPIGQVAVEYVVINPIPGFWCDMSTSFTRHWKQNWLGLDVGHRGLGNSFKQFKTKESNGHGFDNRAVGEVIKRSCPEVRENTIASLKTAASFGADFVEFDVQLSKDLIPVIYHDFHVYISMKRKNDSNDMELLELPVKELTLEQLHLLKDLSYPKSISKVLHFSDMAEVYHQKESEEKCQIIFDEDLEEHQPFPTLQQVLEALDPHVGFNIEIKWTMQLKDGTYELNHPFDINMYLDTVLTTVLQHGGSRKIVFSCFHPDICTMIRLKQNKYPVMFLTQGVTEKYPMYNDPICQTIPMAIHFAVGANILGINVHTEEILRDVSQVKMAKDAGLVIFCWGDDNNDASTIKHLKELGLHAVIYDKMDQYNSKEVKESIFLVEARSQKEIRKIASDASLDLPDMAAHQQSNGKFKRDLDSTISSMSNMSSSSAMWPSNGVPNGSSVNNPGRSGSSGATASSNNSDNSMTWSKPTLSANE